MAPPAWAPVCALENKGYDLEMKGHYARSAEKHGAAVAAARALGDTDSLITACVQLEEVNAVLMHAKAAGVDSSATRYRALQLLRAALPTLQRRNAAGTLRAGACRPAEDAFQAARVRHRFANSPATCATMEPLFGYEMVLTAAVLALLLVAWLAEEDNTADVADLVQCAVSAADMMAQHRACTSTGWCP